LKRRSGGSGEVVVVEVVYLEDFLEVDLHEWWVSEGWIEKASR